MKLRFTLYPKLYEKIKIKTSRTYKFQCSLDPLETPGITANWTFNEELYPKIDDDEYTRYRELKVQGNQGQQQKAFRMLQSRKIVSVKTLKDDSVTFVKAIVKKSYCSQARLATVLFHDNVPQKDTLLVLLDSADYAAMY